MLLRFIILAVDSPAILALLEDKRLPGVHQDLCHSTGCFNTRLQCGGGVEGVSELRGVGSETWEEDGGFMLDGGRGGWLH